ncbi:MAG: hypothetical protein ACOCVM_01010, partial [Desulfovibrionaceae bacterium]
SLHFGLHAVEALDARLRLSETGPGDLAGLLAAAPGPRKYVLLNSRVHHPGHYADAARMKSLLARLDTLLAAGQLHGVVIADAYFLKALGRAGPAVAAELEAVPSVNAMLDSAERVRAWLPAVAAAGFRPPGKLNLDRSLNRDIPRLQRVGEACRDMLPGARLVLLANEGCIPHCPYKPAHDAHIALANMGAAEQRTFELNRCFGCVDHLMHDPSQCLCSPIIRPEDAHHYEGLADGLKVCGRTLAGPERLRRIVDAYLQGRFEGNLLELADSMDWLAERWDLPNEKLPDDFWERVCGCQGECGECGWRRRVFDAVARPRKAGLADLRTRRRREAFSR